MEIVEKGLSINDNWSNMFYFAPRYIWDETSKTLCLDGDWSGSHVGGPGLNMKFSLDLSLYHVAQIYLGDNFALYGEPQDVLKRVPVYVSPKNETLKSVNGILVLKSTNLPILDKCGDGFYELFRNDHLGIVDKNCNQITPCKYEFINCFRDNGLCAVKYFDYKSGNKWGMVNKKGEEQIPLMYDMITEDKKGIKVTLNYREFYIDEHNRPF